MAAINTQYIDNLKAQVDAVPDCNSLYAVALSVEQNMLKQLGATEDQIAILAELIVAPTNLAGALAMLTKLSGMYNKQYLQAIATQTALTVAYADLLASIAAKRDSLSCSFTMPIPPEITPP